MINKHNYQICSALCFQTISRLDLIISRLDPPISPLLPCPKSTGSFERALPTEDATPLVDYPLTLVDYLFSEDATF